MENMYNGTIFRLVEIVHSTCDTTESRFLETMKELGVPFQEDTTRNAPKPASFITKLWTTVTEHGKWCRRSSKVCRGAVVQRIDLDAENQV
jgi:hypothetical protein